MDNAQVLKDAYAAFAAGDIGKLPEWIAEDSVWHVNASGILNGDYEGLDQILGFLGRVMQESGGTFRSEPQQIMANDTHAVALNRVTYSRGGKDLALLQSAVFRVADGKTTEAWFMYDDPMANNEAMS